VCHYIPSNRVVMELIFAVTLNAVKGLNIKILRLRLRMTVLTQPGSEWQMYNYLCKMLNETAPL